MIILCACHACAASLELGLIGGARGGAGARAGLGVQQRRRQARARPRCGPPSSAPPSRFLARSRAVLLVVCVSVRGCACQCSLASPLLARLSVPQSPLLRGC
eukprot:2504604-Rhodomonas_salina.1